MCDGGGHGTQQFTIAEAVQFGRCVELLRGAVALNCCAGVTLNRIMQREVRPWAMK
jgi:hypothetical protein